MLGCATALAAATLLVAPPQNAAAQDTLELVKAQGTHGSGIVGLAPTDRDAALGKLQQWTGVVPMLPPNARFSEDSFETFARRPRLF